MKIHLWLNGKEISDEISHGTKSTVRCLTATLYTVTTMVTHKVNK